MYVIQHAVGDEGRMVIHPRQDEVLLPQTGDGRLGSQNGKRSPHPQKRIGGNAKINQG